MSESDVALSVFEDVGLGLARAGSNGYGWAKAPHVMMVCWLAEDVHAMGRFQRRSVQKSLRSAASLCVFSRNQVRVLQATLSIDPKRIVVVPFGVDTRYFDPANVVGPAGGHGVVAVGSDSRRDYETLFEAASMVDAPFTVACEPRNVQSLNAPPNVSVVNMYDDAYRRLLHRADIVVTPTKAPAYPSGQTVVLEAMSMGKATITTDSQAMRDYVFDGETGILVSQRDPQQLAARINRLLDDAQLRESVGSAAQARARAQFSQAHMWSAVADVLRSVTRDE
ncbi:glycosyltransferase family 4 protein [Microbacterium deminutum]